ncbi:MAG: glycoside hydrolase family 5 protein [Xanthobacteraceae bacterium]|jgi:endoglucanase
MFCSWNNIPTVAIVGSLLCAIPTWAARANCQYTPTFTRGISLASAEFQANRIPGIYGRDYVYPSAQSLDYYKSRGFDLIRLPFLWERLQPALFSDLADAELSRIKQLVAAARDRCMRLILSPHNFGRYSLQGKPTLIGSVEVPDAAFGDFWKRTASAFAGEPAVYGFSLMNEPHDMNGAWSRAAQVGLDAIRSIEPQRLVLVPGDHWTGAWSWKRFNDHFSVHDGSGRVIYEAHQYFDPDRSGLYRQSYDQSSAYPDIGTDLVRPFAQWLEERNARGILAEFGAPNDDTRWLEVIERLLPRLEHERIPWIYWAGGPRWGNYPLSAEPRDGVDAPVMKILTKYGSI